MRYNAVTQINKELVEENNELKMLNPLAIARYREKMTRLHDRELQVEQNA